MMPERTTAVKRATETKEYEVSTKELITASIGTFQDLGYTIDVLNTEFGLITASKKQGTTSTRTNLEEDPFELQAIYQSKLNTPTQLRMHRHQKVSSLYCRNAQC